MKLSIIVPVYNSEEFLHECICSILSQSYQNIELILVDDGSTDDSIKICRQFEKTDDRVKVLQMEHKGPFFARREGVLAACGEYITFVDSDDFVAEDSFSKGHWNMQMKIDIIIFNIYRYYGDNVIFIDGNKYKKKIYKRKDIEKEIYPTMIWDFSVDSFGLDPSLCNKLFKRDLLVRIYSNAIDYTGHYGEDVAVIFFAVYMADVISFVDEAYYYHRHRKRDAIPVYIKADDYYEKLLELYHVLRKQFCEDVFQKQIEGFYVYSTLLRANFMGWVKCDRYIFPFDRVKCGSKVIIYGAGRVGKLYISQLKKLNYCRVVAVVDRNYAEYNVNWILPVESLLNIKSYDYIVLAIANKGIKHEISRELQLKYGTLYEKIVE